MRIHQRGALVHLYQNRSTNGFLAKRTLVHMGHGVLVHQHQGGAPFLVKHYQRVIPMHHYECGALMFIAKILLAHIGHGEPMHPNLKMSTNASSPKRASIVNAPIEKRSTNSNEPMSIRSTNVPLQMWSTNVFFPKEHWWAWVLEHRCF